MNLKSVNHLIAFTERIKKFSASDVIKKEIDKPIEKEAFSVLISSDARRKHIVDSAKSEVINKIKEID